MLPAALAALLCGSSAFAGPLDRAPADGVHASQAPAMAVAPTANLRDGSSIDFTGLLGNQFTSVSPFATMADTPLGNLKASGYIVDTTTPRLLSGLLADQDVTKFALADISVTAKLGNGVDLNLGYNVDLAGRFNPYDARGSDAYGNLFYSASAVNAPYASLANGGSFVGATVALADDLHFQLGEANLGTQGAEFGGPVYSLSAQLQDQPLDRRQASEKLAGVTWDFASWGGLGVVASQTKERNGVLGNTDALAKSANTSALALSARVGFGDGWVTTISYGEGITQLNLKPTGALASSDGLRTRSYGVAVAKRGLFGDGDSLGLAVSRPMDIYEGHVDLSNIGSGDNSLLGQNALITNGKPETDVELGYVTTFLDGALALQANAGYQMNLQGQPGSNSLTVLSRAKINF